MNLTVGGAQLDVLPDSAEADARPTGAGVPDDPGRGEHGATMNGNDPVADRRTQPRRHGASTADCPRSTRPLGSDPAPGGAPRRPRSRRRRPRRRGARPARRRCRADHSARRAGVERPGRHPRDPAGRTGHARRTPRAGRTATDGPPPGSQLPGATPRGPRGPRTAGTRRDHRGGPSHPSTLAISPPPPTNPRAGRSQLPGCDARATRPDGLGRRGPAALRADRRARGDPDGPERNRHRHRLRPDQPRRRGRGPRRGDPGHPAGPAGRRARHDARDGRAHAGRAPRAGHDLPRRAPPRRRLARRLVGVPDR